MRAGASPDLAAAIFVAQAFPAVDALLHARRDFVRNFYKRRTQRAGIYIAGETHGDFGRRLAP